jgi:hypothetical protein
MFTGEQQQSIPPNQDSLIIEPDDVDWGLLEIPEMEETRPDQLHATPEAAFDIDAYFDGLNAQSTPVFTRYETNLIAQLTGTAAQTIQDMPQKVTAERYKRGTQMAGSLMAAAGSLFGAACGGAACLLHGHGIAGMSSAVGQSMGSGIGAGMGGFGFTTGSDGSFRLEGDVHSLSRATGIRASDLASGKYSADDILSRLFAVMGEGFLSMFGLGLVGGFIDMLFNSFAYQPDAI